MSRILFLALSLAFILPYPLPIRNLWLQTGGDDAPVDEGPEVLQVVRTAVLVVEVVGVFPDVDGQQRRQAMAKRVIAVGQGEDLQLAIGVSG